jgi:hypothetical protein
MAFIEADNRMIYLLPPSLADWLPEGHLARFGHYAEGVRNFM